MSSESEESEELVSESRGDYSRRRVSFKLDENGEVLVQVLGESYNRSRMREEEEQLIIPNKLKLTFSREQCDSVRLLQVRDELEKLTKTKEEIREWLSPLDSPEEEVQRAGLILHDGNFQPWFFGKITRRESEALLKDTEAGTLG
ncbi:unnamed protein product [Allacma fusca]|uniref:Uncharacterized protein n=1 Tax=Allacma fusca TaxID=39272 RepID=A0A8J2J5P6_9HEXA|nr:unnamed protein product [Allacma fusca]